MAMKLAIVTPEADVLSIECDEVSVPGVNGEVGFLAGHVPMVTAVRPGVLTLIRGGKRTFYAVGAGFAEVENGTVTVLTEASEESSVIDLARARKSWSEGEEKMKTLSPDDPSYAEVRRRMDRANARIEASQRR